METNFIDYNKYLRSDYWKEIKNQVLERDDNRCRLCNLKEKLHVHHRTYNNLNNEKLEELITLCKKCHYIIHKINPHLSYQVYCNYKKWEAMENKKDIIRQYILLNNTDALNILKQRIIEDNYIRTSEFEKIIKSINKKFNYELFINSCLEYINGESISGWDKALNNKYNLPERSIRIILNKDIVDSEPYGFSRYGFVSEI